MTEAKLPKGWLKALLEAYKANGYGFPEEHDTGEDDPEGEDGGGPLIEDPSLRGQDRDETAQGVDMQSHPNVSSGAIAHIIGTSFLPNILTPDLYEIQRVLNALLEEREYARQQVLNTFPEYVLNPDEKSQALGFPTNDNPQGRILTVAAVKSLQVRLLKEGVHLNLGDAKHIVDDFVSRYRGGVVDSEDLPPRDQRCEFAKTGLLPEQILTEREKELIRRRHDGKHTASEISDGLSEAMESLSDRTGWTPISVNWALEGYSRRFVAGVADQLPDDEPQVSSHEVEPMVDLDDQEEFLD